jgi:hypothetical protein
VVAATTFRRAGFISARLPTPIAAKSRLWFDLISPRVHPEKALAHMLLHCATVCPALKIEFPPSHRVLQLQLPSLIVPSCARAADAKHAAMPKMIIAKPIRENIQASPNEVIERQYTLGWHQRSLPPSEGLSVKRLESSLDRHPSARQPVFFRRFS